MTFGSNYTTFPTILTDLGTHIFFTKFSYTTAPITRFMLTENFHPIAALFFIFKIFHPSPHCRICSSVWFADTTVFNGYSAFTFFLQINTLTVQRRSLHYREGTHKFCSRFFANTYFLFCDDVTNFFCFMFFVSIL